MTDKKTLRQDAKKTRDLITPQADDAINAVNVFYSTIKPLQYKVIAGYVPFGSEFDCLPILDKLKSNNRIAALPKIQKDRSLIFCEWSDEDQLESNQYGIYEPSAGQACTPDVILVPLLAFDQKGNRLGYGGGYYDRTLEKLRAQKEIVAVGIAYGEQACLFSLPTEDHDQKLDWVITPQQAFYFGA